MPISAAKMPKFAKSYHSRKLPLPNTSTVFRTSFLENGVLIIGTLERVRQGYTEYRKVKTKTQMKTARAK